MEKKELEKIVNTILLAHGFRKKSLTWYRERQDALNVINLQKSAYGNQYYLNICFNPAGMPIDDSPSPKEHKCPIRIRFEAAFPNEQEKFNSIFNLEKDEISDSVRTLNLENLFESLVLPFLTKVEQVGLKSAVENGYFYGGAINISAKKYLGISTDE